MIQVQTYLNVIDNTGVKTVMCIKILGQNKKTATVGDIFIGVIKDTLPNLKLKKAQIVRAIVVRTKVLLNRLNGISVRFTDNAAVLINADNTPYGTRIFGPIAREIREKKFLKISILTSHII